MICADSRLARHVEELRARQSENALSVTVSCNLGLATYWLVNERSKVTRHERSKVTHPV